MLMTMAEKMELRRKAKFLEDMGYTVSENEYGLDYNTDQIKFDLGYERYEEGAAAVMRFKKMNESFDVGWIAVVRENLDLKHIDRKKSLYLFVAFIKENYDKLMDVRYCRESIAMVRSYLERKWAEK